MSSSSAPSSTSLVSPSQASGNLDEQAVVFRNATGQNLVGVWHAAQRENESVQSANATSANATSANATSANATKSDVGSSDCAIVMLHGWSGYRTGPHQMLTRAAREFAASGNGVLRFDFTGRGDSDGETETATLATMADDARAAMRWCQSEKSVSRFVLLGLCSGCEVAFACAAEREVVAVALWSAPVFAAGQSDKRRARKRIHLLKQYARKLLRPSTYAKLLSGRLDRASIGKAVAGGGGGENKNVESTSAGHLPPGWRDAALKKFQSFHAPLLLVYGTSDPTTEEALAWHRARLSEIKGAAKVREHLVAGANHSFYGLAWEREVLETTRGWLQELK